LHEQAVLGMSALGHINEGPDGLDQRPGFVENRKPSRMYMSDRSIGHHDSEIECHFGFAASLLGGFIEAVAIVRVHVPQQLFIGWEALPAGVSSVDTEHFVRPVDYLSCARVEGPTAGVRQPLRFGEMRFTSRQSVLCALALRQVEHEGHTLALTVEPRSANQYGHAAAVLADVLPFKRLQAPGALDFCDEILAIAAEPLGT
jgi:hypothetical protein